jgi:RNA polymerase sigma-70 factor (ECF subfamily)
LEAHATKDSLIDNNPLTEHLATDNDAENDPEVRFEQQKLISLALLTSIQLLPPRQRAILLLRDVLDWEAQECAELLNVTVASVNSALHRARKTLASAALDSTGTAPIKLADNVQSLLDRYVNAWQTGDIDSLLTLLKEDANLAMPPTPLRVFGRIEIVAFFADGIIDTSDTARWRLEPAFHGRHTVFALYRRQTLDSDYQAFGMQTLNIEDGQVVEIVVFLYPDLPSALGYPICLAS